MLASSSGEDRYDSCLQLLCGDSSGCERHFLVITESRCLVSYACNILSGCLTITTFAHLDIAKPLLYTLYNGYSCS